MLAERNKKMENNICTLCPRECKVNRSEGKIGYCSVSGEEVYVSMASLHLWEEPYISGTSEMQKDPDCPINGSGTIFFAGCNMHCVYCQNYAISKSEAGKAYSVAELAKLMLELQDRGAANINLVTPTHYTPQIIEAVKLARLGMKIEAGEKSGLMATGAMVNEKLHKIEIPIVYNCSGYEKVETLKLLEGIVDIYLTDFKYMDAEIAKKYSNAPDYPDVAKEALKEMYRQQPKLVFGDVMTTSAATIKTASNTSRNTDENSEYIPMLKKGVVVRHLLLPGCTKNAMSVMKYLHDEYGDNINVSLMSQYTPVDDIQKRAPELNRKVTKREYEKVISFCLDNDIENVFIQEGDVATESFIPNF